MLEELKKELIKYGAIIGERGMTPGISGNISALCDGKVIISSSGSSNGFLSETDLSVIDMNGEVLDGNSKPSTERFLHLEFYRKRADVKSVFHVHSPYLTSFSLSGKNLEEPLTPEIIYCFGKIPMAKYSLPGSKELVDKTSEFFNDYDVILMENHGVIVGGKDVKDAYLKLELCENYAKSVIFAKLLGGANILKEKEVEEIYSLRQK